MTFLARMQLKFLNSETTIIILLKFDWERINGVSYIVYEISRENSESS